MHGFLNGTMPFLYAAVFTIFTPNEYQVINKTIIPYI